MVMEKRNGIFIQVSGGEEKSECVGSRVCVLLAKTIGSTRRERETDFSPEETEGYTGELHMVCASTTLSMCETLLLAKGVSFNEK